MSPPLSSCLHRPHHITPCIVFYAMLPSFSPELRHNASSPCKPWSPPFFLAAGDCRHSSPPQPCHHLRLIALVPFLPSPESRWPPLAVDGIDLRGHGCALALCLSCVWALLPLSLSCLYDGRIPRSRPSHLLPPQHTWHA